MSFLRLPRPIYDAIRAHGEETYPHECCGALLGRFVAADAARNEAGGWVVEASCPRRQHAHRLGSQPLPDCANRAGED